MAYGISKSLRAGLKSARAGLLAASCLVGALAQTEAFAQENPDEDVSPNISVSDRFGDNFRVDGIRSGSFLLFPEVSYTQVYSDNIFGAPAQEIDDFIADIDAALTLRSDWDAHEIELSSGVTRLQFFDNTSESTTDYNVGARGTVDLGRRASMSITGAYARATESRRSLQTAVGDEPVRFDVYRAGVEFDLRQNRFREQFGVSYTQDDYFDVAAPGGVGADIDQDFRDREVLAGFFRQSFRVRPAVALFLEANAETQSFGSVQIPLGESQDSDSYGVSAGVVFDINKVARGEIGVGYQDRNFDSPVFEDISGVSVNAAIEYFLSDLTTVTIAADRSIRNTALVGVAGFYSNGGDITIEHELLRRVILVGRAEYRYDDFRGIDRQDESWRASAGFDYAFRRNVVFTVRYTHFDVSSNGADARFGFDENIVQVGVEFRR